MYSVGTYLFNFEIVKKTLYPNMIKGPVRMYCYNTNDKEDIHHFLIGDVKISGNNCIFDDEEFSIDIEFSNGEFLIVFLTLVLRFDKDEFIKFYDCLYEYFNYVFEHHRKR